MSIRIFLLLCITLGLTSPALFAEQSQTFGDYRIYYNAINTTDLSPTIAKSYGIKRSGNRAILNVSVRKTAEVGQGTAQQAAVKATATNLSGQLTILNMKEINEGDAIYYIGEVPISDQETMDFEVAITPAGEEDGYQLKFRQKFYTR
jgi:hypothetical protein